MLPRLIAVELYSTEIKFTQTSEIEVQIGYDDKPCMEKSLNNFVFPSIITDANGSNYIIASVGKNAFENIAIGKLVLPNTLQSIQQYSFHLCTAQVIDLSYTSVSNIPDYTFTGSYANEVLLPNNIENIGSFSFANTMIGSFIAHSSLILIGASCFANCILLTEIDLSLSAITIIPENCFINSFVQSVLLPDSVRKIDKKAFFCSTFPLKWPHSLEEIGESSFEASVMTSSIIDLSNTRITKIGSRAFALSTASRVSISSYLEIIEDYAFENSHLEFFDFETAKNLRIIGNHAFAFTNLADVNIENTKLTEIGESAFYHSNITSINLPQNLQILNPSFQETSNLLKIKLPKSITTVMPYALANLTGTYIVELANIKASIIPLGCFNGSTSLQIVTLPLSMTYIDDTSFDDETEVNRIFVCGNPILASLPFNATIYTSTYWGFPHEIVDAKCRFYDPETLQVADQGDTGRKDLLIIIIIPSLCILIAILLAVVLISKKKKTYPIGKDNEELTPEKHQPIPDSSLEESDLYNVSDDPPT